VIVSEQQRIKKVDETLSQIHLSLICDEHDTSLLMTCATSVSQTFLNRLKKVIVGNECIIYEGILDFRQVWTPRR